MEIKVETEKKFYCPNTKKLVLLAESLKFKSKKELIEEDEYFTDINSKFIKNRTCLRIRKTNNKEMEITFKGKSSVLRGEYSKLENNLQVDINEYDSYIKLFASLGYYSYVTVIKNRTTYELKNKLYKYSIMIDELPGIGGFVEFEIISDKDKSNQDILKQELKNFISKFEKLKLKEVTEPYRDIVAHKICKDLNCKNEALNICINLDPYILKYEKDFYKHNKNNAKIDQELSTLAEEYLDSLVFDTNEILVTLELLKKFQCNKYFFTKANKEFSKIFLNRFNAKYEDIINLKGNDTISSVLRKNKININNTIIIDNKNFKTNNSSLLVILNQR